MKLPPYAKQLREQRDRGEHPWAVQVFFTQAWIKPKENGTPVIMVPPADYELGMYDFSILSGVAVHLFVEVDSDSHFLQLGIEIAKYAAPVYINFIYPGLQIRQRELDDVLFCARELNKDTGRMAWPAGWSSEQDKDYQARAANLHTYYIQQNPPDNYSQGGAADV